MGLFSRATPELVAVDCSRIPRTIAREPRYRGKPSYALFIFDPAGEFRVWAVLDEDALYFDRDGNGDLTEPGKRIPAKRTENTLDMGALLASIGRSADLAEIPEAARVVTLKQCTYDVGRLPVPGTKLVHTGLVFSTSENLPGVFFRMKWCGEHTVLAGSHMDGWPRFAPSPGAAPVLRPTVLGPLTFKLAREGVLTIGEESNVALRLGHEGSGEASFCAVNDEYLRPGKDRIFATLVAPTASGEEARVRTEIKGHC